MIQPHLFLSDVTVEVQSAFGLSPLNALGLVGRCGHRSCVRCILDFATFKDLSLARVRSCRTSDTTTVCERRVQRTLRGAAQMLSPLASQPISTLSWETCSRSDRYILRFLSLFSSKHNNFSRMAWFGRGPGPAMARE